MKNLRSQLVEELSRELLGPRKGPKEPIDFDPAYEYLVGVLEPEKSVRGDYVFYGAADLREEKSEQGPPEEGEEDTEEKWQPALGTQMGPPKTMGISFLVSGKPPLISFCATWGRYEHVASEWHRTPKRYVKENVDVTCPANFQAPDDTVEFVLRSNATSDGIYRVSLYMINKTPLKKPEYVQTQDLIFQPQIRIVTGKGSEIVEMTGEQLDDEEEASLSLLYKNRGALARGHLCSAVWWQIDPERPWNENDENSPRSHPFAWTDSEAVEEPYRTRFRSPNIRTEFMPCYSIEQKPLGQVPGSKAYKPDELAQIWEGGQVVEFFDQLVQKYTSWIDEQRMTAEALPSKYREIARKHVQLCEESRNRIKEGLEILATNEEARLAFCFMNRAMYLQSVWKPPHKELIWRPFQIAFILQCIPSVFREDHPHRTTCELLWFPTGGGKTEAYLGLAVFSLALRRRLRHDIEDGGAGTAILSRYTLRLLTIQQFRRALHTIMACEFLRVTNWHPDDYDCKQPDLWGEARFSIGLWVGGDVTPNRLVDRKYFNRIYQREEFSLGAVGLLQPRDVYKHYHTVVSSKGDPAQILTCPVCDRILVVTATNLIPKKDHWLHWLVYCPVAPTLDKSAIETPSISIKEIAIKPLKNDDYYVISIKFSTSSQLSSEQIDRWWNQKVQPLLGRRSELQCAKPSLPGYFLRRLGVTRTPIDFEIHCLNPECPTNNAEWHEHLPHSSTNFQDAILEPFRIPGKIGVSCNIPISAYVVDDQVYQHCPSLIVATVDKFARLSFEPHAAAIFGNINRYDDCWGYYRDCCPPDRRDLPEGNIETVKRFRTPDLIIQDELHLIEGPLGSMVGLYETAIDILSTDLQNGQIKKPKYVASSATVRRAKPQVLAVFNRKTAQFPAPGVFIENNFFSQTTEPHQLDGTNPGRLYVGICSPRRGPHTPTIRIWSSLLQKAYQFRRSYGSADEEADQFWTLIGFFNAIRELATTLGLYHQDMIDWLRIIAKRSKDSPRPLSPIEVSLSSFISSAEIPLALNELSKFPENNVDAAFATTMFGTGVDVDRLGLMVVHGQPKTTATYIQATGRVGRQMGGLVVTFLRANRPRDLDHYEFFTGYHRSLARYVEPITVYPFSPRARERALGPICVAILRNADSVLGIPVDSRWAIENNHDFTTKTEEDFGSTRMITQKGSGEVKSLPDLVERRAQAQPKPIVPPANACFTEVDSELDRWKSKAAGNHELMYYEQTMTQVPKYPVVLGDPQHKARNKSIVYENAPQSLREVEATANFGSG